MDALIKAFTQLEPETLIQMTKSYGASKVSNIIVNDKPLKNKIASLEALKNLDIIQALPEDDKKEMFSMFDTAVEASKEISKIKKKF